MTDDTMPEGAEMILAMRRALNQARLAFAGCVSARSAVDMIDALGDTSAALRPSVPDEPREPGEWDDCGDGCYVMQLQPEDGKPGISFEALTDGRFVYNVFGDDGSSLRCAVIPALPDEGPSARIAELEAALRQMVYETTHLSPEEDDGSHWCKISAEALHSARAVLAKETDDAE